MSKVKVAQRSICGGSASYLLFTFCARGEHLSVWAYAWRFFMKVRKFRHRHMSQLLTEPNIILKNQNKTTCSDQWISHIILKIITWFGRSCKDLKGNCRFLVSFQQNMVKSCNYRYDCAFLIIKLIFTKLFKKWYCYCIQSISKQNISKMIIFEPLFTLHIFLSLLTKQHPWDKHKSFLNFRCSGF